MRTWDYGIVKKELIIKDGVDIEKNMVDWHRVKIITYNLLVFGMEAGGMCLAIKAYSKYLSREN
jgi:hypothetical protein